MMLKIRNHERMIRSLFLDYGVQVSITHGSTMDFICLKELHTRKNVTVQLPTEYDFYRALIYLYRTKYDEIKSRCGKDFALMYGTIVSYLMVLQDYNEPLFFTVELYK